jgi:non-lysosomal glucosylceramidase
LEASDPGNGSFALTILNPRAGELTILKGWPAGRWWNSPMLFWDDFSSDGQLGPEAEKTSPVGAICLNRSLVPGAESDYAFLIAWHFPNRTPERCGWKAPKGHERDIIGNWYTTRFPDAWAAAEYASAHLPELQQRTERFADALRNTTLPPAIKEAASANLSTLVSTTCFRTADGEFHAFEGVDDHVGCCFGSCTHVWNRIPCAEMHSGM